MKKFLFSSAILATIALFTACGDDVTEVTEVNEIHQEGIAVLDAGLELSKQKCDKTNMGEMLYVTDSAEVYFCDGKAWQTTKGADGKDGNDGVGKDGKPGEDGDDGDDGESCTAKPVTNETGVEGLEVTCGKTVVGTIWNGVDGNDGDDGESCTAKPVKNEAGVEGLEVTCGKTVVGTIWNGVDGDDGESCTAKPVTNEAGVEGLEVTCGKTVVGTIWNGTNGEDGDDGESCTAKPVKNEAGVEGLEVTCGKTVVGTIWNGHDGAGCTLDDDGKGSVTVTCGEDDPITLYKAMCGKEPYNPAKSFCSEGKLYSCNDEPYDPKKQYCLELEDGDDKKYQVEALLVDARDNQVYRTVTIGDGASAQTWMAQNLNYKYNKPTSSLDSSSFCYGDKADSCAKYGRLYLWSAAMDSAGVFSTSGEGCGYGKTCSASGTIRGVCPEGWHLPSYDEWHTLFTYVGLDNAGTALKTATGWYSQTGDAAGRDAYGFAVLPAGYRYGNGSFDYVGYGADFWSSTEKNNGSFAYDEFFNYDYSDVHEGDYNKNFALSVRCLRDSN